jgi:hypothetical protein
MDCCLLKMQLPIVQFLYIAWETLLRDTNKENGAKVQDIYVLSVVAATELGDVVP